MTPKEFIYENYFSLTLDCKREIEEIYQALEDYAEAKQLTIPVVVGTLCDCEIPKPKDPFNDIDKHYCRDCENLIS